MDKTPQLPITPMALDLWYEGPSFVVADKPQGMAVHPDRPDGEDTLVNGLLQSNRWLAEMETSHTPGVIHRLMAQDRGLVLVAKSEDMAEALRGLYREQAITFSYRVRVSKEVRPVATALVTVFDHQVYDDLAVWDIDSPLGDTEQLRNEWFGEVNPDAYFVAYRMDIPAPRTHIQVGLGERLGLPAIDLYTVPT
jgi:23S rRNA-/tRNA-specific pseudouridylate synthase